MTTLAITALTQIVIMFIIIIVGAVSFKVKLIDKDTNKRLSDIVLLLVNPIVIFVSYQREFNAALLNGLFISLLLGTVTHLAGIALSTLLFHKKKIPSDYVLERFAVIYSNCGFIGIPLVNGVFGSEGVFYLTAYMTMFNLFVWTHGVITMTGKKDFRTITKAFLSPSIIATLSGFLFFILRINLPSFILDSMNYLGNMNTPLAMLVAGVTIAQMNIIKLLLRVRVYYISVLKLVVLPIMMLLLYRLFHIPDLVLLTSILATACPTAVTINLFSIKYGKNYLYATELFTITTLLSVLTIPLVMTIAGFLV
ncbi:MAG: putative rane protein [Herbinix sp.]|jgi:predicted permease|nr:putative rane protein [Herbinix sp.]